MKSPTGARFLGRTAIVTGGGSGIGAALTRALVAAGTEVWCADIDLAAAERVVESIARPDKASAVRLDVCDADAVRDLVEAVVAARGRIDFMFNNAGIVIGGRTQLLALEQWNRIIDINLRGVVHGVHAAYPHMIAARGGHIVNTASAAGLMASGLLTSYSATKFAVVGLSNALRSEAAQYGVGVTVVCPSAVETPLLETGKVGDFRGRDFFLGAENSTRAYSPERLAEEVLAAVARGDGVLVVPRRTRIGWFVSRIAPRFIERRLIDFVRRQTSSSSVT
ncbi:SDR family NAD(P)-dependent oxidoreductase [Nocardia alba]|uniref:NADP-dependent 3-hydroxy acid dehydrogenase YdfG n=1 Tax=Nocardia alba TaxID=225051 RepID=A0A4R1FSC5_9NOCA|nr:SDR family oxidoreductase [Nocardia alba]TCJ97160.1 NADP-dependent 3-hydroxy acid dehydrogenase YdfG [Nocardia alba]